MLKKALLYTTLTFALAACGENTATDTPPANNETENVSVENTDAAPNPTPAKPVIDATKYMIEPKRAGVFEIGKAVLPKTDGDTYTLRKETQTEEGEGEVIEIPIAIVADGGEDLLELHYTMDMNTGEFSEMIGEIVVLSDKVKTKDGLGVGATITDVANALDDYRVWYTYVSDMYIIESKSKFPQVQFLLDASGYTKGTPNATSDMTELDMADFNPDTKVVSIRIL